MSNNVAKITVPIKTSWWTLRPLFNSYKVIISYDQNGKLSDAHLFIRSGLINRNYNHIRLGYLQDVSTSINILERIFGFGDIEIYAKDESIEHTSDGTQTLHDVLQPHSIHEFLIKLSEKVKTALGVTRWESTY